MKSLEFNVSQLLRSPRGTSRQYELDDDIVALTDEAEIMAPVRGELTFIRTNDGVLVTGSLETVVKLFCSRCAKSFLAPVTVKLEELYRTPFDINTGLRLPEEELEDVEDANMIDERHMLDLSEVLRQNLLVSVPPYPVCRTECAGLCPHCGQDLNEGACNCVTEEINPQLAKLQTLLDKES